LAAERRRSSAVDRRALSASLRALREGKGLSLEEAAASALDASGAKLSRIETGKQLAGPRDVRDLCQLYGADEERTAHLVSLATSAREPGWWEGYEVNADDFVGLEAGALGVHEFQNLVVPGLLQTREYAAAYLSNVVNQGRLKPWTPAQIDQMLAIRDTRMLALNPSSGMSLSFLIDEAALRRAVGGGPTMSAQLKWIMEVAEYPHVNVRVLPLSYGSSPGQQGGFTLLTLPGEAADVAYLETLGGYIFLDSPRELSRFRRLFEIIRNSCPDESKTLENIARIASQTAKD
jgi:transcriptional regulator with XRE-family HTH domain